MKKREKLVFTPTFFWEDMTYLLQLIGKLFKKLFGIADDSSEEGAEG